LIGSVLTLEKARVSPNPKGEYIPSKSELCTFSKKEYAILSYFGYTPLWGWGKLGLFLSVKTEPINPAQRGVHPMELRVL
jgi:hypothetical protein